MKIKSSSHEKFSSRYYIEHGRRVDGAGTDICNHYRARMKEHREEMKKVGIDLTGAKDIIQTQDIKNGFIAYNLFGAEGYEEMAYYIPTNAPKFVAIAGFGCCLSSTNCKTAN